MLSQLLLTTLLRRLRVVPPVLQSLGSTFRHSLSLLSELHTASYSISPHFQGKPQLPPTEPREKPAGSIDSYLKSANSWLAEKKDIAERLLKNTENMKGFFGGLETKLKGPLVRKNE